MRGQIAVADFPFARGLGAGGAIPAGGNLHGAIASFALLYNFMANAASVSTAFGRHEGTFHTLADRRTFHWIFLPVESKQTKRPKRS